MNITKTGNVTELSYFQKANRGFEVQSSTNLNPPIVWTPLNVPANSPFVSRTDRTNVIQQLITNGNKYYRVKIYEP